MPGVTPFTCGIGMPAAGICCCGITGTGGGALEAIGALSNAWLNPIVANWPSFEIVTFVEPTRSDHSMFEML